MSMNFQRLLNALQSTHEATQRRAVHAVDRFLVVRNWLFGFYIVEYEQSGEDRASYGAGLIDSLSQYLHGTGIKGVSPTRLRLYRSFYLEYPQIFPTPSFGSETTQPLIQPTPSVEFTKLSFPGGPNADFLDVMVEKFSLSWSHYVELLTLDQADERHFYTIEAEVNHWSVRELKRQIASSLFQRLALSRDPNEIRQLAHQGQVVEKAADLIKNPLVLEFLGLQEHPSFSEEELESAIIDHLEKFLLELGKGFLFESRQKRLTFDNDHFYVDLVFYNRLLRCYVLIDLKRDKLTHQDLGQMQMYVNYFDRHVKLNDELPTIGIVLCHRKNDALVELTLPKDANIFASKYQLYLPSKEELKTQLERISIVLKA